MAAAVFTKAPGVYLNRLENFDARALLGIGMGSGIDITDAERALGHTPDSARRQALCMALRGYAEFDFAMSADTNTAGVINLTDEMLVDFLTVSQSRRIDTEMFVSADVDKAFLWQTSLVACAATPIVYNPAITVDPAGTATSIRGIGAGDLISTAVVVPTQVLSQSSNDVILTLTGVTNIDTRWVGKIKVYPAVAHPLIATT
jgi:hypothetical protein